MKKFKFSLDKVLRQREIQVDLCKKEFIDAEKLLDVEIEKLNQFTAQKEQAIAHRYETVNSSTSWSASVEQINLYLTGQDLRIKNQTERLIQFRNMVESRREILQQALTEAKMIEKLKEKKKSEFFKEVFKKEQQEIGRKSRHVFKTDPRRDQKAAKKCDVQNPKYGHADARQHLRKVFLKTKSLRDERKNDEKRNAQKQQIRGF